MDFTLDMMRIAVEAKVLKTGDTVYGINRKNRHLLKTGKWKNVLKLTEKYVKAHIPQFEQAKFAYDARQAVYEHSDIYRRIYQGGFKEFIKALESSETKEIFKKFYETYEGNSRGCRKQEEYSTDFYTIFKVEAKEHSPVEFDAKVFGALLKGKYMGLISHIDTYSGNAVTKLINYIDQHS
jgi:hypothetical protein